MPRNVPLTLDALTQFSVHCAMSQKYVYAETIAQPNNFHLIDEIIEDMHNATIDNTYTKKHFNLKAKTMTH